MIQRIVPVPIKKVTKRVFNNAFRCWDSVRIIEPVQNIVRPIEVTTKKYCMVVFKVSDNCYYYSEEMTELYKIGVPVESMKFDPEQKKWTAVSEFGTYESGQIVELCVRVPE